MKTFQGITVTVRDKDGNQVLGIDSKYVPNIIAAHGTASNGSYVQFFGDYSIEIVAYTEHVSRVKKWIHDFRTWKEKRELMKRLRKNSNIQYNRAELGQSDIPIVTLRHPTGADFQSPLMLSPARPPKKPQPTSDIINQRRGYRDADISPDASFSGSDDSGQI